MPLETALTETAQTMGIPVKEARSRLERVPLVGTAILRARAKVIIKPGLLGKILKDQIATPLGLFVVNPHDPSFFLKWATLSPTRMYLVAANAGHHSEAGIKNVFDAGATFAERASFLAKKCAVQGTVGLGAGAAVKALEEALDRDQHQTLTDEARDILLHSAATGGYFFLTACIRYQALDKLNTKIPQWLAHLGVPETLRHKSATVLLTTLYFGNAATSAEIYGAAVHLEDLTRNAITSKNSPRRSHPPAVKPEIPVTVVRLRPDGTLQTIRSSN